MNISSRQIKSYTRLYIDYLDNFSKLSNFFPYNPSEINSFHKRLEILKDRKINPDILDILINQNREIDNIKTVKKYLSKKRSYFAIITGQQNGVFGGPLYTLYKILTAKKLSEYLKTALKMDTFVIFWSESDDHDFDEISEISLYGKDNIPVKINLSSDKKGIPIGKTKINSEIINGKNFLKQNLPETDFSEILFSLIEKCYNQNETYSSAFLKFFSNLLNNYEILYFNPNQDEVKKYTTDFFSKTVDNYDLINNKLNKISSNLKKSGYHNQVKIVDDNTNIFISNPERKALKYNSKEYYDLIDIINNNPGVLSTNVLLRPIYQDFIFPDLAYVAGPSEIAYFAQIGDLYSIYGLEMPIVFPRNSLTVLNRYTSKLLNKNFNFPDIFKHEHEILKGLNLTDKVNETEQIFGSSLNKIMQEFKVLIEYSENIDSSISNSLKFSSEKTCQKLKEIMETTKYKINKQDDKLVNDIKRFKNYILPFGNLQERSISLVNFLVRYGFDFPKKIYEKIDLFNYNHKLLDLK